MSTLLAYHNDQSIKDKYLDRVIAHREADQLIQGFGYWKDGKGCAVGCTIHSSDHMAYEHELGIPVAIARLEDKIFEGLPLDLAREWPARFLAAVNPGADLSRVTAKFLYWLLTTEAVNPGIKHPLVMDAVVQCADVVKEWSNTGIVNSLAARSAADSARSAAHSAYSAYSAADLAYSAYLAARSAYLAAYSAYSAYLAADSAYSAYLAARSAADSARSAYLAADSAYSAYLAARSAADSARSAAYLAYSAYSAYILMADKLIELLAEAGGTA